MESGTDAGRWRTRLLKLRLSPSNMSAKADNVHNQQKSGELKESAREGRRRKRIREQGSQTDDEAFDDHEEHDHGCTLCRRTLNDIKEKLDKVLSFLPEIQTLTTTVSELEKEKDTLRESLEFTQAELHELKNNTTSPAAMLTSTTKKLAKLDELERRVIRQECFNRRNNIKFFGIKDDGYETPEETERTLRKFLQKEMKIPKEDLEEIYFERVHRIPTRPSEEQN